MQWFNRVQDWLGLRPPFRERACAVCSELGLEVLSADADSVMVMVDCPGARLQAFVYELRPGLVSVTVFSTVRFAPGRLPARVCETLERVSARHAGFAYGPFDTRTESRFVVRGELAGGAVTTEALRDALVALCPRITALDEFLWDEGYAG